MTGAVPRDVKRPAVAQVRPTNLNGRERIITPRLSLASKLTEPAGKQAELYRDLPGGKVQCTACARLCQIGEGQVGLCGVRGVVGGKLYLLVYGRVMAGHVDPIEKKPVVHYKPGSKIFSIATSGCNWLCHPAGTRILLSDGSEKAVEDLIAGDMVWSYDVENGMKIGPSVVTHTAVREGLLWEVTYGENDQAPIYLTGEHPVFTKSGWKQVKDLDEGDSILRVWQTQTAVWKEKHADLRAKGMFVCKRCGEKVIGYANWNRHRGKCYTEGYEHPAELLAAYSSRMKSNNPMKDPEVARRALDASKARFVTDPTHGWHRNVERMQSWLHRHPSESQLQLYRLLDELSMEYEREYRIHVDNPLRLSKTYYIADAALPKDKLDIEVDGYWHYHNEMVKRDDSVRDATLQKEGWEVLRLSGSYVYNHPEEVKALITEHLSRREMKNMRYWVGVKSVHKTRRAEPVYSIETVTNHNYVADGILVHNCRYCQNYDISQRRKIEGTEAAPKDIVEQALAYGCEGLAYTYNQPTIFMEYARDVGRIARSKGLFNIFVSNGYDTPETVAMMDDFLDCITVDFKGSGETKFVRSYIGIPNADPIFESLLEMKRRGKVHIEITDLIVPQVGDSLDAANHMCTWVYDNLGPDTPVHFLRFHPDYKMMDFPHTPVETLEKHYEVGKKAGLNYVYLGNVPGHPAESTYCPGCGKVLIKRYGYEILAYNLDRYNRCMACGQKTPIVGPLSKSFSDDRFIPVIN
jgi:pyruvate formate lyase activating enzyme